MGLKNSDLVLVLMQIDKTSFFQRLVLNIVLKDCECSADLLAALNKDLTPLTHGTTFVNSAIVTLYVC